MRSRTARTPRRRRSCSATCARRSVSRFRRVAGSVDTDEPRRTPPRLGRALPHGRRRGQHPPRRRQGQRVRAARRPDLQQLQERAPERTLPSPLPAHTYRPRAQPADFPDPLEVDPCRAPECYQLQSAGFHECLGLHMSEHAIPTKSTSRNPRTHKRTHHKRQ